MPKKVKACQCPFQQLAMQQVPTFFGVTLAFGPAGAALQQRLSPPQKKRRDTSSHGIDPTFTPKDHPQTGKTMGSDGEVMSYPVFWESSVLPLCCLSSLKPLAAWSPQRGRNQAALPVLSVQELHHIPGDLAVAPTGT